MKNKDSISAFNLIIDDWSRRRMEWIDNVTIAKTSARNITAAHKSLHINDVEALDGLVPKVPADGKGEGENMEWFLSPRKETVEKARGGTKYASAIGTVSQ